MSVFSGCGPPADCDRVSVFATGVSETADGAGRRWTSPGRFVAQFVFSGYYAYMAGWCAVFVGLAAGWYAVLNAHVDRDPDTVEATINGFEVVQIVIGIIFWTWLRNNVRDDRNKLEPYRALLLDIASMHDAYDRAVAARSPDPNDTGADSSDTVVRIDAALGLISMYAYTRPAEGELAALATAAEVADNPLALHALACTADECVGPLATAHELLGERLAATYRAGRAGALTPEDVAEANAGVRAVRARLHAADIAEYVVTPPQSRHHILIALGIYLLVYVPVSIYLRVGVWMIGLYPLTLWLVFGFKLVERWLGDPFQMHPRPGSARPREWRRRLVAFILYGKPACVASLLFTRSGPTMLNPPGSAPVRVPGFSSLCQKKLG